MKQYLDDQAKETNYHSTRDDESNEDDDEDYKIESNSDIEGNEKHLYNKMDLGSMQVGCRLHMRTFYIPTYMRYLFLNHSCICI